MKYKLGIIGTGVMANAILSCALNSGVLVAKDVIAYDVDSEKLGILAQKGVTPADSIQSLLNSASTVLLSVKPQNSGEIFKLNDFSGINTLISIMAGVKIVSIRKQVGDVGIVRVMPNMPCSIGMGYVGLCFDKCGKEGETLAKAIFSSCGDYAVLTEDKFDALTAISGSGPAYVYSFISGMIKGGTEAGLTYDEARAMTIATFIGAANMVKNSDMPLDTMIDRVCSKGGTTIEAISVYREANLEQTIAKGVIACKNRSEELSNLL